MFRSTIAILLVFGHHAIASSPSVLLVGDSFWANSSNWQPIASCLADQFDIDLHIEGQGSRFLTETDLGAWLTEYQPDLVAVQLGINDVVHAVPSEQILAQLDQMEADASDSGSDRLLISTVTPFTIGLPTRRVAADLERTEAYNELLSATVIGADLPRFVGLVDTWSAWSGSPDGHTVDDGLHPNLYGANLLAGVWCQSISANLLKHPGDANLDGRFNSSDLVQVFGAGLYETEQPAHWQQGDWAGNGQFDSSDLVSAFSAGAYERESIPSIPIPEPSAVTLCLAAVGILVGRRRLI